uniref:Uncharacterized protein n=1 Tax=Caenorhabditis japonica TaxID=281687 RepID=A0A8R1ISQ0_CAEJA
MKCLVDGIEWNGPPPKKKKKKRKVTIMISKVASMRRSSLISSPPPITPSILARRGADTSALIRVPTLLIYTDCLAHTGGNGGECVSH